MAFDVAAWVSRLNGLAEEIGVAFRGLDAESSTERKLVSAEEVVRAGVELQRLGRELRMEFTPDFRKTITDWLAEHWPDSSIMLFDGFEGAFMGVTTQFTKEPLAVYDWGHMVRILVDQHGMDEAEANEYLDFNTTGAWVGEKTPQVLYWFKDWT